MTTQPQFPGVPTVINGNGAVAHVMKHVCGGVIGYPITPSTEISEIYEAARAEGALNVWGKHSFFFEPEGEHSAQSGALGAALTGGQFISNASSSQGILYAMESHYVTVGKKIGGFVLQVAARVVSKHSLNVMAGHDDVYALLSSGYTVLFGANPQEAADLAAISYRTSALSLIPVANAMDGFSTSHMLSEALMPEPEMLREYLGDPAGRIVSPTVAQDLVYGAKGRVHQLKQYLARHRADIADDAVAQVETYLDAHAEQIEPDYAGEFVADTLAWIPEELHGQWRRQWMNAHEKGTRQMVPALVDVNNPGLTGPVQNQPDFQAGAVDHRTHFASAVPDLVRQAMREYGELTGRAYTPIQTFDCDDADYVMVGLGSVTDDVQAVLPYLRKQGLKVGLVAVKLLQPFPEAELVEALAGKKAVTVLERSDQTALTSLVTQALFKANANANGVQYPHIPALASLPRVTTAIFGLGGHDLQPRHLIAAYKAMDKASQNGNAAAPLIYLGSQFFSANPSPHMAEIQSRLRTAYPETELMALETEENPRLLPEEAMRIRFHSVGGYGTIATGKLLTDILAGALGMNSKSAPKYGSEKSGAPTNYYITLSPEPVKITNAELEDVEIVISPDHKAFAHTNPLKGLVDGGTFIMQSSLSPLEVWKDLPASARAAIRAKKVKFFVIDAFSVAKVHAPNPALETRMMGIAFIGAVAGNVDRVSGGADREAMAAKVRQQIEKKFGSKGAAVVAGNMAVIEDGIKQTVRVDYDDPELAAVDATTRTMLPVRTVALSASMCECPGSAGCNGLFDREYYDEMTLTPFKEGTIGEAPVLPGIGLFIPAGTAAMKDKGLFRRSVPEFHAELCTGCMECTLVCPDAAIPNTVHEIHDLLLTAIGSVQATPSQLDALRTTVYALTERVRGWYREHKEDLEFSEVVAKAVESMAIEDAVLRRNLGKVVEELSTFAVARTRPFFDAMEAQNPGSGGLFSATVDPWKCTGCLECVDVCGPAALVARDQDQALSTVVQQRFEFMSKTPNTPSRFFEGSIDPDGEVKRLMLDRGNYYATTGGHGGCRGCGEVTAIRLVMASSHALGDKRRKAHIQELEELTSALRDKLATMAADPSVTHNGGAAKRVRVEQILDTLERRLYLYEGGPTGQGPASTVVANATGCSSVYASTMPFNPYNDPWVNSLFQDAQPLAKGIFEGISSQLATDVKALRLAQLVLDDVYDPLVHDEQLRMLSWSNFTPAEMALLPTVMTIGGDGATYDIGFGALSRVLASETPIKVLVLNTGAYSNTGGQASTSSFTGQDSDLARVGAAHDGKHETRKELGLIASFHPNVFVCSTSPGIQGHYLRNTLEFLTYTEGPAVMDVYTPCQGEHGIPDDSAQRSARLAVESRMSPVFVHDPRRGTTLHDWFSLDGNPDPDQTWTSTTLEYTDEAGQLQLMDVALTPAYFAVNEGRFRKHFHPLAPAAEAIAVPVEQFIDLPAGQRAGQVPFIYAVNNQQKLVKLEVGLPVVALVEERRRNWQMLQYLSGVHLASLTALHQADVSALQQQFEESTKARENSLDEIARAMSELAAASRAPATSIGLGSSIGVRPGAAPAAAPAGGGTATALVDDGALVRITDQELCTDCGTCYQEIPQLFQKTKKVIDGQARQIAEVIPGAAEKIEVTPELTKRIERVKATCDAEIIR
ncbi:MAG: 2-oxoacid:acceptor oxidoreductase family protein [Austwickia sp.]|nr:2-oxoacid:acceptor oxidoreductase family protein [Austwickia sp.]MBK8437237.1 2-oxoacid:acceptor oxidoreductase family protein [Austwickia sp.]